MSADRPLELLVVEDDDIDEMAIRRALTNIGFGGRLHVVKTAEAAAAFLAAGEQLIDLILLDLSLPGRSGHEFLQSVRQGDRPLTIPIVVLTSSSAERDRERCFAAAAAGYFVKSLASAGLEATLRQILGYWQASCRAR